MLRPAAHYCLLLPALARLIRRRMDQALRPMGMTESRWRALAFLTHSDGLTQTELADMLDIEKAPLGVLIDRLEAESLVERVQDPADRRVNRLRLRPEAAPLTHQINAAYQRLREASEGKLAPSHQRTLTKELSRILQQLSEAGDGESTLPGEAHYLQLIGALARLLGRRFRRSHTPLFTPIQWWVLGTVQANEGLSQTDLAERLGMARAPLGQILDTLENNGWIERTGDPKDRRIKRIHSTEAARTQSEAWGKRFAAFCDDAVRQVGPGEHAALLEALHALHQQLIEDFQQAPG